MAEKDKLKQLEERLSKISALEQEVLSREKALKEKEGAKKQVLLRLSLSLWNDISKWAEDDFRSINGQIEFLLANAVQQRKKKSP